MNYKLRQSIVKGWGRVMDSVILAVPLLPDKAEAWRRFCQEMMGRRRQQYERSRRRLEIAREAAWLVPVTGADMAIIVIAAPDLEAALNKIATSQRPFDRWFRRQIFEIHGVDLSDSLLPPREPAFQWNCPA